LASFDQSRLLINWFINTTAEKDRLELLGYGVKDRPDSEVVAVKRFQAKEDAAIMEREIAARLPQPKEKEQFEQKQKAELEHKRFEQEKKAQSYVADAMETSEDDHMLHLVQFHGDIEDGSHPREPTLSPSIIHQPTPT
jgi:alpha-galactosidase/6-phospho-beta-glucosidase family protein